MHLGALRAREVARREASQRARQYRQVVVQVLLEEGVVGRDEGQLRAAREAHARVVRDEGRVDVHQVEAPAWQRIQGARQRSPAHAPVLGVGGHAGRGHAQHLRFRGRLLSARVERRDQQGLGSLGGKVLAEGADGGGDAVDAREVHVGDEQHPHALGLAARRRRARGVRRRH